MSDEAITVTRTQMRIVRFIRQHTADHGYPPSIRDIGNSCGLRSTSSVAHHIDTLRRKGVLRPVGVVVRQRPGRAIVAEDVVLESEGQA